VDFAGLLRRFCVLFFPASTFIAIININAFIFQCLFILAAITCIVIIVVMLVDHSPWFSGASIERNHWRESTSKSESK
jgi:type III secretory pathway component EscT